MNGNSRSLAERVEQVLPTLNLAVLLIPVVVMAMQLGSAAAGFVAATAPTDVAELETPVQARTRPEPPNASAPPQSGHPTARNGQQGEMARRVAEPATPPPGSAPSLADPLLGYGI